MPTVQTNFQFTSDAQSFTFTGDTADTTLGWSSTGGNTGGCISSRILGRNKSADPLWEWTGTWESLGVPSGATVTHAQIWVDWRCSEYNVGNNTSEFRYAQLWDLANTVVSSAVGSTVSATTSYATAAGALGAVAAGNGDSTDAVAIHADVYLRTGNNASAAVTLLYDNILVEVTYTVPTANIDVSSSSAATDEAITGLSSCTISLSEGAISIAEEVSLEIVETATDVSIDVSSSSSISDEVTIEALGPIVDLSILVEESITITESFGDRYSEEISVYDIAYVEVQEASIEASVNASSTTAISEAVSILVEQVPVSVSDLSAVTDSASTLLGAATISVSSTSTVSDESSVQAQDATAVAINISSSTAVTDTVSALLEAASVNISSSSVVTDEATVRSGEVSISTSSSVAVSDETSAQSQAADAAVISVSSSVAITDEVTALVKEFALSVSSTTSVSDETSLLVPVVSLDASSSTQVTDVVQVSASGFDSPVKLYMRTTGFQANRHLSPIAGSSPHVGLTAYMTWGETSIYVDSDVFHVYGATETLMGSSVAQVGGTGGTYTNTWTPSNVSGLSGGSSLRILQRITTDFSSTASTSFYSGPLAASGISSTEWTFSYNFEIIASDANVNSNTSDAYIDGITLTGEPTTMRLYLASTGTVVASTTIRGTWNATETARVPLGHKAGSNQAVWVAYNGNRHVHSGVSLPLVRASSFISGSTTGALGIYQQNSLAQAKLRMHCWVGQSGGDNLVGTLVNNHQETDVASTSAATGGEGFTATQSVVSANAGDRLIAEIGFNSVGGYNVYSYRGGTGTTDLADNESLLLYPGWIEFSIEGSGPEDLEVSVSDSTTISDEATVSSESTPVDLVVDVSDSTSVSDAVSVIRDLSISLFDRTRVDSPAADTVTVDGYQVYILDISGSALHGTSQSMRPISSGSVSKLWWYCRTTEVMTGNVTASVYNHTGIWGETGTPTGSPLATTTRAVSTIPQTWGWIDFTFDNTTQLSAGTPYVVSIEFNGGVGGLQRVEVAATFQNPHNLGNEAFLDAGDGLWYARSSFDAIAELWLDTGAVTVRPSDPSVNVSETVTVTEEIEARAFSGIEASDSSQVSDEATLSAPVSIDSQDSVALSDEVTVLSQSADAVSINVSSSSAASDLVQISAGLAISVSSTSAVTDAVTGIMLDLNIDRSSSTVVTDERDLSAHAAVSVQDTTVVSDEVITSAQQATGASVDVSSSSNVSDQVVLSADAGASVASVSTVSDQISLTGESYIDRSTSSVVADTVELSLGAIAISVESSVAVADDRYVSAPADNSIDVSSSSGVSDDVDVRRMVYTELIIVTDDTQITLSNSVEVSSSSEVTDAVSVILPQLNTDVSDAVAATDSIAISAHVSISVSDDSEVTDATTVIPDTNLSVADTIAVSDDSDVAPELIVSVQEVTTVTEAVTVATTLAVSVQDSSTASDTQTVAVELIISTQDQIAATDFSDVAAQDPQEQEIDVSSSTAVSDAISLSVNADVSVSDGSTVTDESQQYVAVLHISVEDNVILSETLNTTGGENQINTDQGVTVTDDVTMVLPLLNVDTSSTVVVTDQVSFSIDSYIRIDDSTTVTDLTSQYIETLLISVEEAIPVTDQIAATGAANSINTDEAVSVTDEVSIVLPELLLSVEDSVSLAEERLIAPDVAVTAVDSIVATDSSEQYINELHLSTESSTEVTDYVTVIGAENSLNVDDSTTVTDEATVILTDLYLEVLEGVGVTDEIDVQPGAVADINVNIGPDNPDYWVYAPKVVG